MTRGLRGWNRTAALLTALLLVVLGAAAIGWRTGRPARWWSGVPDRLDLTLPAATVRADWWPWALAGGGTLLGLLGLWWLTAHARRSSVTRVTLAGSDRSGLLELDTGALGQHVAQLLSALPQAGSARARLVREGGRPVLVASLRTGSDVDLAATAAGVAALGVGTREVSGLTGLAARVRLQVTRRSTPRARVR